MFDTVVEKPKNRSRLRKYLGKEYFIYRLLQVLAQIMGVIQVQALVVKQKYLTPMSVFNGHLSILFCFLTKKYSTVDMQCLHLCDNSHS